MWNDFELISDWTLINDLGDTEVHEQVRHVQGEEASVGMKEFYQGMAVGLKPEVKIILTNWLDYQGEQKIRYTPFGMQFPVTLDIIRTYRNGEALELTCQRGVDK